MSSKSKLHPATDDSNHDAIAILMADHQRVARLFAEFDTLKDEGGDDEKALVVAKICDEVAVHTAIEEEIFYPAVRKAIDDDNLMDEAWVEQAGAKGLAAQLQAAQPEDDFYDAKLTVLAEQIDHHVQEEEKDMFPQARRSGIDTLALGAKMLARKAELLAAPSKAMPTNPVNKKSNNDGATKKKR